MRDLRQFAVLPAAVDLFHKGDRPHDEEGSIGELKTLQAEDIQDVLPTWFRCSSRATKPPSPPNGVGGRLRAQ